MEIIHVVLGKANPNRMNGVNKVVYQLACNQAAAGKHVSIWGITKEPVHNYPERNFETRLFKAFSNKFKLDAAFLSALKEKKDSVVFHLHGGFNPVLYSVSTALYKHDIPFVFTPHGAYNEIAMQHNWITKWIYTVLFERKLIHRARIIHCLGKTELDGLNKICSNAKARLLPYGYESELVSTTIRDYHSFNICFCGRTDIYTKGLDVLLNAYCDIKKKIPAASLWIIGSSDEQEKLKQMINSADADDIVLFGSRYGNDKEQLLKQAHVFAHPSRNEGLPSAVLEAASFGIPCAVTEATNMGESIRRYNCGTVIAGPSPVALANAITGIYHRIKKEGWKKISDAAREMIREEYNWNKILKQFDDLYKEAC